MYHIDVYSNYSHSSSSQSQYKLVSLEAGLLYFLFFLRIGLSDSPWREVAVGIGTNLNN